MTRNRPSDAVDIRHGDALDVLRGLPDESVEAFITDPPYGLSEEPDMAEVLTHWLAGDDYKHRGGGFMGRTWDSFVPGPAVWREAYRVLKPGGHLLCFAGTRTSDLMGISIRLAGFEIRDRIRVETTGAVLPAELGWLHGQGFPKNLDVGKAIDRQRDDSDDILRVTAVVRAARDAAGLSNEDVDAALGVTAMCDHWCRRSPLQARVPTWEQWRQLKALLHLGAAMDAEVWRLNGRKGTPGEAWARREVITERTRMATGRMAQGEGGYAFGEEFADTAPATEDAARWDGWGTALKPAFEPIIVARKPLISTVAQNVLTYGTGALNIDATRVATDETLGRFNNAKPEEHRVPDSHPQARNLGRMQQQAAWIDNSTGKGRWPSNVILVHGEGCVPVGTRKVRTSDPRRADGTVNGSWGTNGILGGAVSEGMDKPRYGDEDGTETVEAWECVEGCPVAEMDAQSGNRPGHQSQNLLTTNPKFVGGTNLAGTLPENRSRIEGYNDEGGASRFFPTFKYQAKADGSERPSYIGPVCHSDSGCSQVTDDMHPSIWPEWARDPQGICPECGTPCGPIMHPTVKPLELARWLIRLVVAKGGTFIDPFVGSGTFAEAAILEGVDAIVVDKVGAHIPLIEQRVKKYDDPHAMAAAQRGDKVPTRTKPRKATADDEDDLFAGWAS